MLVHCQVVLYTCMSLCDIENEWPGILNKQQYEQFKHLKLWKMGSWKSKIIGRDMRESTYIAASCNNLLWFSLPAKAAEEGGAERVAIVNKYIVVWTLCSHTSKLESNKLAAILGLYQPFTVRVLEKKLIITISTG